MSYVNKLIGLYLCFGGLILFLGALINVSLNPFVIFLTIGFVISGSICFIVGINMLLDNKDAKNACHSSQEVKRK